MSSFTFAANLFKVGPDRNTSYPGAPTLVPDNGSSYDVDVYSEYPWTVSDDARNYIPKILLTEYKLTQASELNAFENQIAGGIQNLGFAAAATPLAGRIIAPALDLTGKVANKIGLNKITSLGETFFGDNMFEGIGDSGDSSLSPYRGLYTTEKTGWGYILPYLGPGNMADVSNTFEAANYTARFLTPISDIAGALGKTGAKGKALGTVLGGENINSVKNITIARTAGALKAEAPQSFTGTSTENIAVEFYLLNTIKPEDIRKNYEFCYLFTYQNLPNRRAINVLDDPPLYRATVIGYKTLPVCYIEDLKIENVGAVRLIDIGPTTDKNNAANSVLRGAEANSDTVKMIPEAYKISFILKSAFMNSQNIFVFAANPQGIVTTSVVPPPSPAGT